MDKEKIVLSADDDENAHFLLKRAFLKAGSQSVLKCVNDGDETLRYLQGEGVYNDRKVYPFPHLLLLDLKMPKVSGFEVLQFLRDHPQFQPAKTIAFSSSGERKDIEKAQGLGADSYIIKPTDFSKLIEIVRALELEPAERRFATDNGLNQVAADNDRDHGSMDLLEKKDPEIYRLLVDQVKDYAIFILDRSGRVVSWNEGARRIIGYEAREIIGKHVRAFYPNADVEAGKPEFEIRMAREMGRYEDEGWRMRKDGSRYWASAIVTPLVGNDGILSGFVKVLRDLTQRKFQEENLQKLLESEERFRLLVEQVKDYGIFMLDAKGNISTWNLGAHRIKGYTADEILGKHFSIFYPPEDVAAHRPDKELTVATQEGRYEEEGWRVRKDGTLFWANIVITSLWDKRGNLTGFAKVTRDLTQRRKEMQALRQKSEELEAFAHALSHDLRVPIRSIAGFARLLQNEGTQLTEKDRAEYLKKITRSAVWMNKLVEDLSSFSQLNDAPIPNEVVSLHEIVKDVEILLEEEIQKRGAIIKVEGKLPAANGGRTLWKQVFSNLIGNALKFIPERKTPEIVIRARELSERFEIHVRDNGIGISPEYHQRIFMIFERLNSEEEFAGSGMGLAIVKKALERIGGGIRVDSLAGKGANFIITLPGAPKAELVETVTQHGGILESKFQG